MIHFFQSIYTFSNFSPQNGLKSDLCRCLFIPSSNKVGINKESQHYEAHH
jgi:hypothetical protein